MTDFVKESAATAAAAEALVAAMRMNFSSSIQVWINGTKHAIEKPDPEMTLLEYLRGAGLTGTKLGCGEVSHPKNVDTDHPRRSFRQASLNTTHRPTSLVDPGYLFPFSLLGPFRTTPPSPVFFSGRLRRVHRDGIAAGDRSPVVCPGRRR